MTYVVDPSNVSSTKSFSLCPSKISSVSSYVLVKEGSYLLEMEPSPDNDGFRSTFCFILSLPTFEYKNFALIYSFNFGNWSDFGTNTSGRTGLCSRGFLAASVSFQAAEIYGWRLAYNFSWGTAPYPLFSSCTFSTPLALQGFFPSFQSLDYQSGGQKNNYVITSLNFSSAVVGFEPFLGSVFSSRPSGAILRTCHPFIRTGENSWLTPLLGSCQSKFCNFSCAYVTPSSYITNSSLDYSGSVECPNANATPTTIRIGDIINNKWQITVQTAPLIRPTPIIFSPSSTSAVILSPSTSPGGPQKSMSPSSTPTLSPGASPSPTSTGTSSPTSSLSPGASPSITPSASLDASPSGSVLPVSASSSSNVTLIAGIAAGASLAALALIAFAFFWWCSVQKKVASQKKLELVVKNNPFSEERQRMNAPVPSLARQVSWGGALPRPNVLTVGGKP